MRWRPSTSSGVTRYDLFIGTSPGTYDSLVQIPVSSVNVFSNGVYSKKITLQSDVAYYMALRAYDGLNVSSLSNEIFLAEESSQQQGSGGGSGASTSSASASTVAPVPLTASASAGTLSTASPSAAITPVTADPGAVASSTDGPLEVPAAPLASIQMDGQYLGSTSTRPLGASGRLSVSMWLRPFLDYAPRRVLFDVTPEEGAQTERIALSLIDGEDLELVVHDPDGVLAYRAIFELAPANDLWQHLAVVFDPDVDLEPRVYLDLGPCTLLQSEWNGWAFGLPSAEGFVRIGGSAAATALGFIGRIGHTAIWADALSRDELSEIHARGHQVDLRGPVGTYDSFDDLIHYWRLGDLDRPIGYDLGTSDAPIDLDDPAGGVGPDHVVQDGPTALLDTASGL